MSAAIILVHGLRTSATMWRQQVEELERSGIRAITLDLPGHGTRIAGRFSFDAALTVIGDAISAATAETGEKPYLVGFSLGGYLSIEYLARHPGSVCGLLAASCGTSPNRVILGGWRLIARGIHRLPDRGRLLNQLAVRAFVPPIGAADVLAGGAAIDVMDDALSELRALDPVAALSRIAEPVLFVNGQLDHFRMHERRYIAAARNSRLVTIAGSTHMVSVTRPRQFTAVLLSEHAAVVWDATAAHAASPEVSSGSATKPSGQASAHAAPPVSAQAAPPVSPVAQRAPAPVEQRAPAPTAWPSGETPTIGSEATET